MSSSTRNTSNISNCISAHFDPIDGESAGSWSLCYQPGDNQLTMSVNIKDAPEPLISHIDQSGLQDMIEFLYQVKVSMQKKG